jgi:hypothetical protein
MIVNLVSEAAALVMEQMEAHATQHAKMEVARMCADEEFTFDRHYTEDQAKMDSDQAKLAELEWTFVAKTLEDLDGPTISSTQQLKLAVALKITSTHVVREHRS